MKFLSLSLSLAFTLFSFLSLLSPFLLGFVAHADEFGQGDLKFHISFVPIASNEPSVDFKGDSMPYTDYDYRISQTEISIAQFLQARGHDARISRSVVDYWNAGRFNSFYERDEFKFGVSAPATHINIIECFKFCNWLTSGDPYQGAYKIAQNANPNNDSIDTETLDYVDRESALAEYGTVYVVPTYYEWNKAAFFKPDGSGFSFYSNGAGSGNIHYHNDYIPLQKYIDAYGETPTDVMFIKTDNNEETYRYYDTDGVEQIITPLKGLGGWNSAYQIYPWLVGSSAREQNGTYDMYGNVGEYFEEITAANNDFRSTASCWNVSGYLGGSNLNNGLNILEVFSPVNRSHKRHFYFENTRIGTNNVGLRVVALGAVPETVPLPEVESTITDGVAHLNWGSTVGRIYQLQYSNSIEDSEAEWVDLGQRIHGSGGTEFIVVPVDNEEERNRFYRVVDFD